jgi:hypothetical protein
MIDTDGRALMLQVHLASVQDRDGTMALRKASRRSVPFVEFASQARPTPPSCCPGFTDGLFYRATFRRTLRAFAGSAKNRFSSPFWFS